MKSRKPPTPTTDDSAATPPVVVDSLDRARKLLNPGVGAAQALAAIKSQPGSIDLAIMLEAVAEQTQRVRAGELSGLEDMLVIQAYTLDATFNDLMRTGMTMLNLLSNARVAKDVMQTAHIANELMRIATKAQSQCRTTIESLAALKNPQPAPFHQTNIAHGPQQVNNGIDSQGMPHPKGSAAQKRQNKLLEVADAERLDTTKARSAGTGDPAMETVATINRAENKHG